MIQCITTLSFIMNHHLMPTFVNLCIFGEVWVCLTVLFDRTFCVLIFFALGAYDQFLEDGVGLTFFLNFFLLFNYYCIFAFIVLYVFYIMALSLLLNLNINEWKLIGWVTKGQSNSTKSASRGAHSPVRGHPRGSKVVPLNSWGRVSY